MKRLVMALLGALVAAGLVSPAATLAVDPGYPKVALIVGPVGPTTDRYRALARDAADIARRFTPNVVEVYSPDATWPAVAGALDGASIIVYLGHGNGWPSRYRDQLYPITQNGFGLNPVAGVDDDAHQYFGEASLDAVRLAPNAVVLLHHLCYASGNTEPGLPEGTLDQAVQRVDNYAAGFIRAGARAVVAEGHFDPAWYVHQVLTSQQTIERIWQSAPSRNGHEQAFASSRSPGYLARLDPDTQSRGFYRSLVTDGTLDAPAVRGGARGLPFRTPAVTPSLASLGLQFAAPRFSKLPVVGVTADLSLPVADGRAAELPPGIRVGVRWDALDVADGPAATPPEDGTRSPGEASPEATTGAPAVELVVPERPGSIVEAAAARATQTRIAIRVTFPAAAGLYRLVPTLHQPDGVAYDAATQAMLTPVLVRVGGPLSAAYGVTDEVTVTAGEWFALEVRIANTGLEGWAATVEAGGWSSAESADRPAVRRLPARLVASWVSTQGATVPEGSAAVIPDAGSRAGGEAVVAIGLVAPETVGAYLVVLDVATPLAGPLSAAGSAPAIVRVTVAARPDDPPAPLQPAG